MSSLNVNMWNVMEFSSRITLLITRIYIMYNHKECVKCRRCILKMLDYSILVSTVG